jgi:hypothetical protein
MTSPFLFLLAVTPFLLERNFSKEEERAVLEMQIKVPAAELRELTEQTSLFRTGGGGGGDRGRHGYQSQRAYKGIVPIHHSTQIIAPEITQE